MGNISDHLPQISPTIKAIYAHWKKRGDSEQTPVNALGCSQVGHQCERYLWYMFRHCCKPDFDGRMYRLFDRGCLEEPRMVQDLRAIGCTVHEADENGEQFRVEAFGGHLSGYLDGCVLGVIEAPQTWHVLEVKAPSAKNWRKIRKHGLQKGDQRYYVQCMLYMHLSGMKRTLFMPDNRDTEELYAERIRHNKEEAEEYMAKAKRVITATEPQERPYSNQEKWPCSFCDAKHICYGSGAPLPALPVPYLSCRQCCHATPDLKEGEWVCEKHKKKLCLEDQLRPCDDHLTLPCLLSAHNVEDCGKDGAGNDYICFCHEDGDIWKHGKGGAMVTSEELTILPWMMLPNKLIQSAKEKLGAKADGIQEDLWRKYQNCDTVCVWSGALNFDILRDVWNQLYDEDIEDLEITCKNENETHIALEYGDGRVIFCDLVKGTGEIRERKPTGVT